MAKSTVPTKTEQPNFGGPYHFAGALDKETIDSLSNMDVVQLFNSGFSIIGKDMIHVMTPDSPT